MPYMSYTGKLPCDVITCIRYNYVTNNIGLTMTIILTVLLSILVFTKFDVQIKQVTMWVSDTVRTLTGTVLPMAVTEIAVTLCIVVLINICISAIL